MTAPKYNDLVHNLRMHRVHAPGAAPPSVAVSGDEAHHLSRVLRLRAGDAVGVFDGRGREWRGRVASIASTTVVIDSLEERAAAPEPAVEVTLGIARLKGDQMDAVVRDATMMGVRAIAPFVSAHVAAQGRARHDAALARWTRVAVASAKQCGRAVVPDVRPLASFEALVSAPSGEARIVCVEPAAGLHQADGTPARPGKALVLVGPEGGWTPAELDRARASGASFLQLGPRTLRAESAPIVALSALWARWGWT
jgi:16S rRNA (uracil1498-N3)-methyltransferase